MSGLITIIVMSSLLGAAAFGIGMLPLFFSFSSSRIAILSTVGTGLLLGAALGVIIPEGIETLLAEESNSQFNGNKVALSLLSGFAFMLVVETFSSGHSHSHNHSHAYVRAGSSTTHFQSFIDDDRTPKPANGAMNQHDFDVALSELESHEGMAMVGGESGLAQTQVRREGGNAARLEERGAGASRERAFPLTLGLVIHSLADGLALVVFLAIIVHKAPTSLALTMSLLGTSVPRSECRKHIAAFSAATPIGALLSYGILSFIGSGSSAEGDWTGIALLISGGTFLYVATVLQPVSSHDGQDSAHDMSEAHRAGLIIFGMFTPFIIGLLVDHDHGSALAQTGLPIETLARRRS